MKGDSMKTDIKAINMEKLLTEAEELIQGIDADFIKEMEEEHRLQFELYAQTFKDIKTKVQGEIGGKDAPETSQIGEGMHEAILDIIKSMQEMTNHLT